MIEVLVGVLADLMEQEPVAKIAIFEKVPKTLIVSAATDMKAYEGLSQSRNQHGGQSHKELEQADHDQEDEPEPEYQVDLLVDDVLGEDAVAVDVLQLQNR